MKVPGKRKPKRRALLFVVAAVLIAGAAGLFLVLGIQLAKLAKHDLAPTPTPSAGFLHSRFSFGDLAGKTLDPNAIVPYVTDIPGVHGLGAFDNSLYVSSWTDRAIYKVDLADKRQRQLADELNGAHDMVVDDGKIVTPLYNENRVVKVDPQSGRVTQLTQQGLSGPNGIAKARDGGYYVTNAKSGTVVKVSADGSDVKPIATGLKEPAGIISDPDNILYVAQYADPVNSVVQVWDNGQVKPLVTGLTNAETLLRDDERNLIIGHTVDGRAALSFFKRGGSAPRLILQTSLPGPMVGPVTDTKNLYFESAGGSTVYRIAMP